MALGATTDAAWRARLRHAGSGDQEEGRVLARIEEIAADFPRLRNRSHTSLDEVTAGPDLGPGLAVVLDGLVVLVAAANGLAPHS